MVDTQKWSKWNDICPPNTNLTYFGYRKAMYPVFFLVSIYALIAGLYLFTQIIQIRRKASGLVYKWYCCCSIVSLLPVFLQFCLHVALHARRYFTSEPVSRGLLIGCRIAVLGTQFIRNWIYANAAGVEFCISLSGTSWEVVRFLRYCFYAQVSLTILAAVLLITYLIKCQPFLSVICSELMGNLHMVFVAPDLLMKRHQSICLILCSHVFPGMILVVFKCLTVQNVLQSSTGDMGVETRLSFVNTHMQVAIAVGSLLAFFATGELTTPMTKYWAWSGVGLGGLVDAMFVVLVNGTAGSEVALRRAKRHRRHRPTGLWEARHLKVATYDSHRVDGDAERWEDSNECERCIARTFAVPLCGCLRTTKVYILQEES